MFVRVQVAVEGVHHFGKVVKGSNIVCFVVGACNLRRKWLECVEHVNKTFCFTGAIDVLES